MAIDHHIPTMSGHSTSCFQRPGRHCLHQARSAGIAQKSRRHRPPLLKRGPLKCGLVGEARRLDDCYSAHGPVRCLSANFVCACPLPCQLAVFLLDWPKIGLLYAPARPRSSAGCVLPRVVPQESRVLLALLRPFQSHPRRFMNVSCCFSKEKKSGLSRESRCRLERRSGRRVQGSRARRGRKRP